MRDALAQGPIEAMTIERRAVDVGLLAENTPIGKSKVFRSARALLGVNSYQKPGRRAGGWIWRLLRAGRGAYELQASIRGYARAHAVDRDGQGRRRGCGSVCGGRPCASCRGAGKEAELARS
jgi:hypothetical protein